MNSMHQWCKRKRLKSGGSAAILCKEGSSSNIFRACTFGWLDSNQPKPTQHWTCNMIFLAQPLAPSKTPKARCRQSSSPIHICLVLVGLLRYISHPLLQPSYAFSFTFPKNWLDVVCFSGFPVLNDVHCNAALRNEDCSWLIFLRASTWAESKKILWIWQIRNILHKIQRWK